MKHKVTSAIALVIGCWIASLVCVLIGGVATCWVFGCEWSWPLLLKLTTIMWVIQLLYIIIFRDDD